MWKAKSVDNPETPLAMAERHVAEGEIRIRGQEALLAELERNGHDAAAITARELLAQMREFLDLSRAHRARLLNDLAPPGQQQ